MFKKIDSARLMCEISRIEIYRLKHGPDYCVLQTNLPSPMRPYVGGLRLTIQVDRGSGPDYCAKAFPGAEITTYDHAAPVRSVEPAQFSRFG